MGNHKRIEQERGWSSKAVAVPEAEGAAGGSRDRNEEKEGAGTESHCWWEEGTHSQPEAACCEEARRKPLGLWPFWGIPAADAGQGAGEQRVALCPAHMLFCNLPFFKI